MRAAIEPALEIIGPHRDGHTVMQHGEIGARGRSDDRDRVELLAVRTDPGFRECCESERAAIAAMDEERPLASAHHLPFVVTVSGDQAATALHRILERRLVLNRLRTRVDQQRNFAGILDPGWYKSPTHQPEMPRFIVDDDHGNRLRRCDIMPWRKVRLFEIAKNSPQRFGRRGNDKSSAHSSTQIGFRSAPFNPLC